MKYWLATHRVNLHKTHGDLIGCRLNNQGGSTFEPCSVNFKKMSVDDFVVVCSRSGDMVFGIYQIISEPLIMVDDPEWGSAYCFKLNRLLAREPYPSFKKFKEEFKDKLSFVKNSEGWEGSSVGWVREIQKLDYQLFVTFLERPA
jgi:hypothetical protein